MAEAVLDPLARCQRAPRRRTSGDCESGWLWYADGVDAPELAEDWRAKVTFRRFRNPSWGLIGSLAVAMAALAVAPAFRIERSIDLMERLERELARFPKISIESVSVAGSQRRAIASSRRVIPIANVPVFPGARLRLSFAIREEVWSLPGDGVTFQVRAGHGKPKKVLFSRYIDPKSQASDRVWVEAVVPLSDALRTARGEVPDTVDLTLLTSPGFRGDGRDDAPVWADLRVVKERWEWPWSRRPRRPNVVVISLDTLRDDRVGAVVAGRPLTPRLDAIEAEGFRFRRAYAPANHTLPSHMSLVTGLSPATHGVKQGKGRNQLIGIDPLPHERVTLAETLQSYGYVTSGFAFRCVWLDGRFGFAQGFDRYEVLGKGAEGMNDSEILPWLEANHALPFFLFVHFYDVHSDWTKLPYDSPREDRARHAASYDGAFDGCGKTGCATLHLKELDRTGEAVAEGDLAYIRALYDAGVEATDRQVGRIVDKLAELGILDETLLVISSDHGEEFREHGRFIHGQIYDEVARVVLLFRLPGLVPSGGASLHPVGLVDVMPTILDLVGVRARTAAEGRSLRPAMDHDNLEPSPIFVSGRGRAAVVAWPWKMIRSGPRFELYNLDSDPSERVDRAEDNPAEVRELRAALTNRKRGGATPGSRGRLIEPDAGDRERLRALGYLDHEP